MDDYLKTDMTEFGLTLMEVNPSAKWIVIPPEIKWVDAYCSRTQLSALKYIEVQNVDVLLSIRNPPKKIVISDSSRFWNIDVLVTLGRIGIHEIEITNNKYYTSEDGIVYTKNKKKLLKCPPKRTGHIVIPNGVQEIGERAFANSKVASITFPDSLRKIEYEAFMHCIKLNQIDFGREVKEIGTAAFEWCSELTVLKFPQQIKKICEYAFRNCISLKKVVLNDGLKTISCGAFDTHSANMESVKLPKSLKHLGPDNFDTAKSIIIDEIPKKAFVKQLVENCTLSGVEALNRMAGSSIHATKLEIAGKTMYLPCVVSDKKAMSNLLIHPERYGESYALGVGSFACDAAVLSYMAGYEEPKEYIIQNDIRVADRLIDTERYEEIIKCLPLFQDCTVKLVAAMTQNSDNAILRAYLLGYMKEDKTDFDI